MIITNTEIVRNDMHSIVSTSKCGSLILCKPLYVIFPPVNFNEIKPKNIE